MRTPQAAVAALVVTGALAACSGGFPAAAPSTAPPTSASPSPSPSVDPAAAEQVAVVAAYRAYWDAVVSAGRTADWRSPALAGTATGDALRTITERLRQLAERGRTLRGAVRLDPAAVSVTASTATVRDCQDSSGWLVYDRAGRPLGTGVPRDDLVVADLVRVAGRWKVERANVTPSGC